MRHQPEGSPMTAPREGTPFAVIVVVLVVGWPSPAHAYIDIPPATLGRMCDASMSITLVQDETIRPEKNLIVYRAVRDLKGNGPSDLVKHVLGSGPEPGRAVLRWAEVGKRALHFASASRNYSYTYIDGHWYA